MSLSTELAAAPGLYIGTGDGVESGAFVSRIAVSPLVNGGAMIDYEATSRDEGLLHREQTMVAAGPDGRDRLYIAHSESPFVTELVETATDSGRFEQPTPAGPYVFAVVITAPEPGRITYAWWWAEQGAEPTEQSKADARLQSRGG